MTRFGVATSAFQVEGGHDADGRGPSTWDEFCTRPGAIKDGSDARVACDSYHRFAEDLALLVELGVGSYRFSIAWPRVQPAGAGPLNEPGLAYYDRVVDALLDKGICPFPTLYHWDLPLPLEEGGGWPARDTAMRFRDYATAVVARLGDRVGTWATMNEPWCTALLGHAAGVFAPGERDPARAYDAAHHLLLGHALAARALPDHDVGIVLNLTTVHREPDGDPQAADLVDAWQNRLWLDALVDGRYPDVLGLPRALRDGDLDVVRGSAAWLGINYYTPFRIGPPAAATGAVGQDVDAFPGAQPFSFAPRPPFTTMGWEVDPRGLVDVLQATAQRAPGVPLRVTENGGAFEDDADRITYLQGHLEALQASGVEVLDYFAWSLLDNFEWAQGYTQRFGLVSVEPGTLRRVPKGSFRWYQAFLARPR
ncbi:MAG: broad-specificity cellobiase [Frankiales bacterium]|nr:broad-specificity cellobiase [Frankiales bacterium]